MKTTYDEELPWELEEAEFLLYDLDDKTKQFYQALAATSSHEYEHIYHAVERWLDLRAALELCSDQIRNIEEEELKARLPADWEYWVEMVLHPECLDVKNRTIH
ncbi:hypothetical protein HBA55_17885 [Pseudomaricurvus alkylphenolicus]|jgi:hypothetical protein|uniref:hypothetical protein n=1 Tax=Pseudomaricurvus alkylphenolicus TaxID=1306991 RepID=UPI001422CA72|nr:hypothetical protein [Pseudomaricurvus alkylphenolicus]NIB41478.1 hypothetical protein [Pseudomaricurvus alkylphenolicus]